MAAAVAGHTEMVQLLVDHGANLSIRNDYDESVLDVAMTAGYHETVRVLLNALGGPNYPLEDIALDIAMSDSIETTKSLMLTAGVMYPATDTDRQETGQLGRVARAITQGRYLVKPRAMLNMMHAALHEENVKVVHGLSIFINGDRNKHLPSGDTPLTFAVGRRSISLIQKLLEWGHDTSKKSRRPEGENYTPLLQALIALDEDSNRDTSVIDVLIKSNRCRFMAGKDARSSPFDYVLSHYSRWDHGLGERITSMMLHSAEHTASTDRADDGSTLLHVAVWHGRTELIQALLSRGANINATDKQGCTPFFLECQRSTRLLRILLSHGANPHATDNDGQGALHAAAAAGNITVINLLLTLNLPLDLVDISGYTPFTWSVLFGQEATALHLLSRGATTPTQPFRRGRTLLHTACSLALSLLVPILLTFKEFDVNARDELGFTPLALACRTGSAELISALLDAGANPRLSNNARDSPLHIALSKRNVDAACVLVHRGADANARGEKGKSALHLSAAFGTVQIVRALLDKGADVHALDDKGRMSRRC
ncbi:ankyrin [Ophiobolus disseminans]|uniref:Ankyrin n=1 Tax=Ophiobolus disseminans TaxID=1469910 RepID=A0A6A7AJ85_9PLEO|nr:ankyrin [Ophiobolus disseminans]